jgi:aspartyl-tRNA(Asn)/glutamyl-tRNA(Gln) amidotransferase subunit A
MDLHKLSITRLSAMLRAKEISCSELVKFFLKRIEDKNPKLNALLTVRHEAEQDAARIDTEGFRDKDDLLKGIPVTLKDNMLTEGVKTTCASKILADFIPSYNATIWQRLKNKGVVLLGKANMDEFAMGSSNENSAFGPVRNPWSLDRVPGGSSGGSGVSVAAGLSSISYGTDTGGSVRLPASFNAILSIKPTYGRISRYGIVAFGSSLDQVGALARNVSDLAIAYDAIAGFDPKDSTTSTREFHPVFPSLDPVKIKNSKFKIGVPWHLIKNNIPDFMYKAFESTLETLKKQGCTIEEVSLPNTKYALDVYYIIATGEASSNLARFDGIRYGHRTKVFKKLEELYSNSRGEGFGEEVKRRIMIGTFTLSAGYYDAYFSKAAKVRTLIKKDFTSAYQKCDAILMPVSPVSPFKLGERIKDPLTMYLADIYTISINLAAVPSLAFPAGFDPDGLPMGFQLVGRHFDEQTLFELAQKIEFERPELFNNVAELKG